MIVEKDVAVAARDGVALRADVYRLDDAPRPALLALSPYGKGKQVLGLRPQPGGSPLWDGGVEAGDTGFLLASGYVHVIADARGTGHSDGDYRGWMAKSDGEDGHDLVEWIAAQPWCDGNVGMVGISAFGTIQLHVAAEQPPHLKAIMPWNAPADFYRECTHHGGILQTFFHELYTRSIRGRAVSVTAEELDEEGFRALREAVMEDPDLRMYTALWNLVDNPRNNPSFLDVLLHPLDGPFYWERSANTRYDRIRIPVYARSGWWAYAHMHLVGTFEHLAGMPDRCRIRIGPMIDDERPLGDDYNQEAVRWYDRWLKGVENGVDAEPPVALHVMGSDEERLEPSWPLPDTTWTELSLGADGTLGGAAGGSRELVQPALVDDPAIARLAYATRPLRSEAAVIGPLAVTLQAALDREDGNWIVALLDVAPDGTRRELSRGYLKASHRALDPERSEPWRPYHTHRAREPVEPGEVVEYRIALAPTANVFAAGHRIVLEVMSADHRFDLKPPAGVSPVHLPWHVCSSRAATHTVHGGTLLLPVVPREAGGPPAELDA